MLSSVCSPTSLSFIGPLPVRDSQPEPLKQADFADVSDHQKDVNWDKYAASGRQMAICKASEGYDWADPSTADNRAALNKLKLGCGLYHFAGSTIHGKAEKPEVEAKYFLDQVGKLGPGEFPVLDFERSWGMTPSEQCDWMKRWCTAVEKETGKTPWVYIPTYILKHLPAPDASQLTRFPLWIANYQSQDPANPPAHEPWPNIAAWQYSASVEIPGIGKSDDSFLFTSPPA
jgi:GH25 family lysozyme M1 (1,4-beta-N-acetylmuramidase)